MLAGSLATPPGAVRLAAVITHTSGARVRAARGAPRQAAAAAAAVRTPERGVQGSEVQEGAQVVGTVLWAGPKGAKVQLADDTIGFMPSREAPFVIRDALEERSSAPRREGPCVPKGLVRAFKVINVPAKGAGKAQAGPLLSARLCDLDVLWHRAAQLCDLSTQHKENLRVTVEGANNGGLLSRLNGLSLFVPVSQLEKRGNNEWWTEQASPSVLSWAWLLAPSPPLVRAPARQDMAAHYAGRDTSLAILEVARASRKVVCSVVKARENDDLRQLEVGTLVHGIVRRIEPFGVFVGINNTRVSGLLHISNVSRQHIDNVQDVFEVGEEVKCLVMGLDPGYTNISLSIAELELEEGDVLRNKQRVWENAEAQALIFNAHLEELREQGYDFDQPVDP